MYMWPVSQSTIIENNAGKVCIEKSRIKFVWVLPECFGDVIVSWFSWLCVVDVKIEMTHHRGGTRLGLGPDKRAE